MLFNRHDRYIGRSLDLYGEFSEDEIILLERFVRPGDTVIDGGANIGTHSIPLALMPKVLADSGIVGEVALARGKLATVFDYTSSAPERDTARVAFVLPAYLVIGRDGRVVARSWGPDAGRVRVTIDSVLASRAAP